MVNVIKLGADDSAYRFSNAQGRPDRSSPGSGLRLLSRLPEPLDRREHADRDDRQQTRIGDVRRAHGGSRQRTTNHLEHRPDTKERAMEHAQPLLWCLSAAAPGASVSFLPINDPLTQRCVEVSRQSLPELLHLSRPPFS